MILGIYCAGGLGREVLALVQRVDRWENVVFIDDNRAGTTIHGFQVLTFEAFCELAPKEQLCAVVATGETATVQALYEKVNAAGIRMETIIDPSVYVPDSCKIGQGVIVQRDALLATDCILEDGVYINFKALLAHDVKIDRFANISLNCTLAGGAHVGECSYVAAGSIIRESAEIGKNSIIGMGSVVTKNIPDNVVAYGYPCKVIRENESRVIFQAHK